MNVVLDPLVSSPNISQQAVLNGVGPSHLGNNKSSPSTAGNEPSHPAPGLTGAGAVVSSSALLAAQESTQAQNRRPDILAQRQQANENADDSGLKAANDEARVREIYQSVSDTDSHVREILQHEATARASIQLGSHNEELAKGQEEARDHASSIERERAIAAYEEAAQASAANEEATLAGIQLAQPFLNVDITA